ncbi:MAG: alpha/beta fold hydrolase [Candidatus Azotimanducaceae bacterium]
MATLERTQDVTINYRVDGDGDTTWLLLNGATLPLEFWDPLARALALRDTVVRFDQRNAGATRAQGSFSLLDTAADAAAVLEHLGVKSVIVVGHAWGGRVAQVFARDYPHLCQALVICGTGGHLPATVPDESLVALREAGRGGDKADVVTTGGTNLLCAGLCGPSASGICRTAAPYVAAQPARSTLGCACRAQRQLLGACSSSYAADLW